MNQELVNKIKQILEEYNTTFDAISFQCEIFASENTVDDELLKEKGLTYDEVIDNEGDIPNQYLLDRHVLAGGKIIQLFKNELEG